MSSLTSKELEKLNFDEELGISEDEVTEKFRRMVEIQKEIARIKGAPTCELDAQSRTPYLLYPDGTRVEYERV